MFSAPLHPKIVHMPMALAILMPLIAIGLLVAWREDWLPGRAWWIAVLLQALLFGSAWVAMETGETDEEKVEQVLASEEPIHEHEERADTFFWGAGGVLVVMLAAAFVPGRSRKQWLAVAASAGTLVVFWLGYRTGEAGGKLVYEHGAADAHIQGVKVDEGGEEEEEHEH